MTLNHYVTLGRSGLHVCPLCLGGVIYSGDVQWMTAGSGIIHQEMPKGRDDGRLWGFQLWANLPAADKMMHPRYRGIVAKQIPEITFKGGVNVKIVCGKPIGEPVAWYGPIVMNTQEELRIAFEEYEAGTFVK